MSRKWKLLLRVVVYGFVLLAMSSCMINKAMFPVPPVSYAEGDEGLVFLRGVARPERRIPAFWFPNDDAGRVVIHFHGNGEDIGYRLDFGEWLHGAGFAVLLVEYPGYGLAGIEDKRGNIRSESPTEAGIFDAAEAAFRFVTGEGGFAAGDVVAFGSSLGSGPATELAVRHPGIAGLIIECGFLSAFRVVTSAKISPFDRFDNASRIKRVTCRLLVIHGTDDDVVPFWHGEKLYELAGKAKSKEFVPVRGGGHLDWFGPDSVRVNEKIVEFANAD